MQKKSFKISMVILFVILCIAFYFINQNFLKDEGTIDLVGKNKLWKASLNIHLNYDSELIIEPRRNDFNIPSEINIDIIMKDNILYSDTLEYITSQDNFLGRYVVVLDSDDFFKKDIDNIQIIVRYDNESSIILLNEKEYIK